MAIAYRASSTPQHLEAGLSPHSITLPTGHASGDLLFFFSLIDDNTGLTSVPSGWTKLGEWTPSTTFSFLVYTRTEVYYRIDTGSLGASFTANYSSSSWPVGQGSIVAWTSAYSGCDTSAPIESFDFLTTRDLDASQVHPQMLTVTPNDWLLTLRTSYSNTPRTFTASGGTNSERIDDNYQSNHGAFYDSNGALGAGLQTQRTTLASGTVKGGSTMLSIVIKPAPVAGSATASPTEANTTLTAYDATVTRQDGDWSLCTPGQLPTYQTAIDWIGDGDFTDPGDDVTGDIIDDVSITYGRDQDRQFSPATVGSAAARLNNTSRKYSPEYAASPLNGNLDPARDTRMQVTFGGNTYALFRGRLDDYEVKADYADRSANFTFLDGLSLLQGYPLSTALYSSMRTGTLINTVLDLAGWTGPRSIDNGATIVRFWWADGTDALSAIQDLVNSEGPPSIAYQAPDGTFVFRDRHHRLLRGESLDRQGTFASAAFDCATPAATGLGFTKPFSYANGWRDISNTVSFDVGERVADLGLTAVWTSDSTISLGIGESTSITVSASDPFQDAVTPVNGTDYIKGGAGTAQVTLSRTSGITATISILAIGGPVVITDLQLRARAVTVRRNVRIARNDPSSISTHGTKAYSGSAPWAGINDADAIASMVLLHYSQRRPTIQMRIATKDPAHFLQVLKRTVSDRIRVINGELGLDSDFFVERITHAIQRVNRAGHPPVHSVTLGCEKDLVLQTNPFTFDLRGAGFDQGVFDPIQADNATTVFVFDNPGQGRFDVGLFGT